MGMSPEAADTIFWLANWMLIGALVLGVLATYAIVVSGNVRDANLKRELSASAERAATAELKLEQLRRKRGHVISKEMNLSIYLKISQSCPLKLCLLRMMGRRFS